MSKRDIPRRSVGGYGPVLEIGGDVDIPDQLAVVYAELSEARAQVYELEQLIYEMRERMGVDPEPEWREHTPGGR